MHKYLRAVGFSDFRKRDLEILLDEIIEHPEMMRVTRDSEENEFAELSREFAPNIGITVRGIFDDNDKFEIDYYYPFLVGTDISTYEEIEIQKHAEKESYAGVCDEIILGVTLIFYLQNVSDYLSEYRLSKIIPNQNGCVLSALSVDGKILCPIQKKQKEQSAYSKNKGNRSELIAEAREGNEEAIESLTLEDMDTYSLISKRVKTEDVLSIVDTCFMPFGVESDQYSIIGEIRNFKIVENKLTKENIYIINIVCNDLAFDVCINQKDLLGEPAIGRRFKGNIWMQGYLNL